MNWLFIFLITLSIIALALLSNGAFFMKGPVKPRPLKLNAVPVFLSADIERRV